MPLPLPILTRTPATDEPRVLLGTTSAVALTSRGVPRFKDVAVAVDDVMSFELDKENVYDSNALHVLTGDGTPCGMVPAGLTAAMATLVRWSEQYGGLLGIYGTVTGAASHDTPAAAAPSMSTQILGAACLQPALRSCASLQALAIQWVPLTSVDPPDEGAAADAGTALLLSPRPLHRVSGVTHTKRSRHV